jgi:hypothetical protein
LEGGTLTTANLFVGQEGSGVFNHWATVISSPGTPLWGGGILEVTTGFFEIGNGGTGYRELVYILRPGFRGGSRSSLYQTGGNLNTSN